MAEKAERTVSKEEIEEEVPNEEIHEEELREEIEEEIAKESIIQDIVSLQRISHEDQSLMQKNSTYFIENRPELAGELGTVTINATRESTKSKYIEASNSEDEECFKKKVKKKENKEDYVPDSFSALVGKKRKIEVEKSEPVIIEGKLRKVEKEFGAVIHKLSAEEPKESNFGRFNENVERVLKFYSEIEVSKIGDVVPDEQLLNIHVVQELCTDAAKLNVLYAMETIPPDKLVKLLNALELTIRGADRLTPTTDGNNRNMERVMGAADASIICMRILTLRRVYIEEVIDRVVLYIKYQMLNTIFPSYDVSYKLDNKKKGNSDYGRRKKVLQNIIQTLYKKIIELVSLLSDLMDIQVLNDTSVLFASSLGVAPFFVDNVSELQRPCLKLVTTIFSKYEKHRRLLLDDILDSIARLPSPKRSLRTYRLNTDEKIQTLTALVLQLIQCIAVLPENLSNTERGRYKDMKKVDKDVLICNKSRQVISIAATFLSEFLSKCGNKSEEIDYKALFENFVQDLSATVNKPEWPASELVLDLLGKLLVSSFSNKCTDVSLRGASLDYLGIIAVRLRQDSVLSRYKLNTIDQMIAEIQSGGNEENEISKSTLDVKDDLERIQFFQGVLLDFLAVNAQNSEAFRFARHFYIVQWYKECNSDKALFNNKVCKNNFKDNHRRQKSVDTDGSKRIGSGQANATKNRNLEERKKFLLSKIRGFKETVSADDLMKVFKIDYNGAELIAQFLASKRQFSQCFDQYLNAILAVLKDSSIAIRTKAMKCLTMIVEADPSMLGRQDVQKGVNSSFSDPSASVRETAVDLVGKFVLNRPELLNKYYEMLSDMILDTSVAVRKRIIKIFKCICVECPEFPKINEICVKMIRRVNDEESIRKLVIEVFENMWFTPIPKETYLLEKVLNITNVVASCKDIGWFEQLLVSLFKLKEDKDDSTKINKDPSKTLLLACGQIVDCVVENVLQFQETDNGGTSESLIAPLTTLYLFAKIRPQLLVKHAIALQPYLVSFKCETTGDSIVIMRVSKMLELVVPLIEHPSDLFLAQLEEDVLKLILKHDRLTIASCVSCLGAIVNKVTRNFQLIRECFSRYYVYLERFQKWLSSPEEHQNRLNDVKCRQYFRRSLFIVGFILRYFDFKNPEVTGEKLLEIKYKIFPMFNCFLKQGDDDIQTNALKAMGSICIRHYEFMLEDDLRDFYRRVLTCNEVPQKMKIEVICNIQSYLTEEETRMVQEDLEWSKRSKEEDLKEMGEVSSGMASTIIQLYLKEILQSYLHRDLQVRVPALKVIQIVLQQGLVHPVQIVPYLICMSTDIDVFVSHTADKQLQEIVKKYPGFIHAKSTLGIQLSYELQRILQGGEIVRGFKIKGEYPCALNGFFYSLLRSSRQQRRTFVLNILKQFDDQARASLPYMLYLADNLAYLPYQVQEEPLFIVHHIDIMIAVSGMNVLQTFREGLMMTEAEKLAMETSGQSAEETSALDEDVDALTARVPENVSQLQACLTAAQGCLLLTVLRQHIQDTYGLSDAKIQQYSPSEPAKVFEKITNKKTSAPFNPKATVNKIREGAPPEYLDCDGRKELIKQYLHIKRLLQFDSDEVDGDENVKTVANRNVPAINSKVNPTVTTTSKKPVLIDVDQVVPTNYKDNLTPKVPKLVSNRRIDVNTKQNKRTSGRKRTSLKIEEFKLSSSEDENENDYSDPDFVA